MKEIVTSESIKRSFQEGEETKDNNQLDRPSISSNEETIASARSLFEISNRITVKKTVLTLKLLIRFVETFVRRLNTNKLSEFTQLSF